MKKGEKTTSTTRPSRKVTSDRGKALDGGSTTSSTILERGTVANDRCGGGGGGWVRWLRSGGRKSSPVVKHQIMTVTRTEQTASRPVASRNERGERERGAAIIVQSGLTFTPVPQTQIAKKPELENLKRKTYYRPQSWWGWGGGGGWGDGGGCGDCGI